MCKWLQKRNYIPFLSYRIDPHQARLASSGAREAARQPHIRAEGWRWGSGLSSSWLEKVEGTQGRGRGPMPRQHALPAQQHLWNSIIKNSLPLAPERGQHTTHWIINSQCEFVHQMIPSGSGAGGSGSSSIHKVAQVPPERMQAGTTQGDGAGAQCGPDSVFSFSFSFSFFFFRATPMAYGSFQAKGLIGAAAAGLNHSHSNAGSLTHWGGQGIKPTSSWILVSFANG